MRKLLLFFSVILFILFLLPPAAESGYKVKKPLSVEKPVFASVEEARLWRLRHGEVLSDGGYRKRGVWGRMEGVIEAPPEVIWRLFTQANEWKKYGIPNMRDSRAVSEEVALQSRGFKEVKELYALVGDRTFDATEYRRSGAIWVNYTFHYFDLPWPVANKWMVLKNVSDETRGSEGIYRCEWSKRGGNVNTMNGRMTLVPFEGDRNRTYLDYRIESDPASHVPRFLLKWGIRKTMPTLIRIVRREAARLQGRAAPRLVLVPAAH